METNTEEYATLKLTKPYMHGSAVRRLQEFGDQLGFDRGPNDGIFGAETEKVVLSIQSHVGIKKDGICGPKTWEWILNLLDYGYEDQLADLSNFIDIRGEHPRPKLYHCQRRWDSIIGVVIHQTGCKMPLNPKKWERLNAHIGITRDGEVVYVNDPCDWIWHAQGLSKHSIGIEIAGNFPGIQGNMKTLWKGGGGPHELTQGQQNGLDEVFTMLKAQFEEAGAEWKYVNVHRQSAPSRVADPGSEIYQKVVIPWMERLGATDGGPDFTNGKGRRRGNPVPKEWNPDYTHRYYSRLK